MNTRRHQYTTSQLRVDMQCERAFGTAISHLPDALRWVMILGGRNGLSTGEIAKLAGVSSKVVESTQHRGLTLVQKELLDLARMAS